MRIRRYGRGFAADAVVLDETWTGYGTSMHYPYCRDGRCTGCLPPMHIVVRRDDGPSEGAALGVSDAQRQDPVKLMADAYDRMLRAAGYRLDPWQARMLYAQPVVNDPEGGRYVAHGE